MKDSPSRPTSESAAGASPGALEVRLTALLVTGALLAGALLQVWIAPGALTLVVASGLAGAVVLAVALLSPGRMRATLAGFRFTSTLLVALAVFAIIGTLVLQGKPAEFYRLRYGAVAPLILGLRFDDVFHGLPFAGLVALFGAAVVASATLRWPVRARNAGFFLCHLGLLASLGGAAASAALSIRGRIDLHAGGETATHVRVTKAGMDTGGVAPLGFDLRLERFDLVNYESEYRVGYYRQELVEDGHGRHRQWKLVASFDPDLAKHLLPGGDTFRLKAIWPDAARMDQALTAGSGAPPAAAWRRPVAQLEVVRDGRSAEKLVTADPPGAMFLDQDHALVFEKRDGEVKAFLSTVTATRGGDTLRTVVAVNEPVDFGGWTLYQVNYNPQDPTYSGLEAVHDPGVPWVFTGFALICLGVAYMFYVEPRLKGRRSPPAATDAPASPAQAA